MKRQSRTQKALLAIALTMASILFAYPAAAGYVPTNVVLRSGPSAQVPAVGMVLAGSRVHLYGCEKGYKWCDVRVAGRRGWMSAHYVSIAYRDSMVLLPTYVQMTQKPDIAVVPFNIDSYWSNNYSDFYFYDEIGTWRNVDWGRDE
ncbi:MULTISPECIES: SH3 domain-containing protein [unclassified Rhizobium]|uniref:SH3 domain-containing protein n=1 Tax=unclassified Rhizobium TaxID=2613769 RepID=UPI0037FBA7AE